jgi:hypothetical protein
LQKLQKIEVPTKKPKTAQNGTKRHKVGQNGTKRDKAGQKNQKGTKFQRDEANRILKVPSSSGEIAL